MAVGGVENLAKLGGIGRIGSGGEPSSTEGGEASGFKAIFDQLVKDTNNQLVTADRLSEKLLTGQIEDVSQVTIAAQKAELSLQLAIQMRNKLLEAYQEIMRMPV